MSDESKDQPPELPSAQANTEINKDPSKNIVVLCDGTANQVSVYTHTNIVRLASSLDKTNSNGIRQVVYYDPGLGTEAAPGMRGLISKKISMLLGLAFGYGLSKNIADAYAFLMQNYVPGDRIYIFGFSRGAYTARALTGLLGRVGLLEQGCTNLISYAIRYYQARNDHQLNFFKKRFSRTYALKWSDVNSVFEKTHPTDTPSKGVIPVHFLGVWDTVKSVGVWPIKFSHPDTDWLPNMINGRHAVAINEKRSLYRPVPWHADTDSDHEKRKLDKKFNFQACLHQDVETMWFSGAHADVGGGYGLSARQRKKLDKIKAALDVIDHKKLPPARKADDKELAEKLLKEKKDLELRIKAIEKDEEKETALAKFSLQWMMEAAKTHGLQFEQEKKVTEQEDSVTHNQDARLHNSLLPNPRWMLLGWWALGWWTRALDGARVHPSVQDNIENRK